MEFVLVQQITHQFLIRSGIGNDMGVYREITGLIIFSLILINFSLIPLYLSSGKIIFVRLFHDRKGFALVYVPFDKRKPTAGYFKLHRLLYFIRAVGLPTLTGSRRMVGVGRKSCTGYTTAG